MQNNSILLKRGVRMAGEYWTTEEVCKFYKISSATLYRWRQEGLPSTKVGRGVRNLILSLIMVGGMALSTTSAVAQNVSDAREATIAEITRILTNLPSDTPSFVVEEASNICKRIEKGWISENALRECLTEVKDDPDMVVVCSDIFDIHQSEARIEQLRAEREESEANIARLSKEKDELKRRYIESAVGLASDVRNSQ